MKNMTFVGRCKKISYEIYAVSLRPQRHGGSITDLDDDSVGEDAAPAEADEVAEPVHDTSAEC